MWAFYLRLAQESMRSPEKIAETKDKDAHTNKLHNFCKRHLEIFDQIPKHWSHGQRAEPH